MKYKVLTDETKIVSGRKLYRIQAIEDFSDVMTGDKGGWVESEYNLSQEGLCWLYDDAIACGNAVVSGNATLSDIAQAQDFVNISGDASVTGTARITDCVVVDGLACVDGAFISGTVKLTGNASIIKDVFLDDGIIVDSEIPRDVIALGAKYKKISSTGSYPVLSHYYESINVAPKELKPGFREAYKIKFHNGSKITFTAYEENGKLYHDIKFKHFYNKETTLDIEKCPGLFGTWEHQVGAEIYNISVLATTTKEHKKGLFSRER